MVKKKPYQTQNESNLWTLYNLYGNGFLGAKAVQDIYRKVRIARENKEKDS